MNVQEFAALKVGDKISNPMNGSTGHVTATNDSGVRVAWGVSPVDFMYTVNSTAWMHWTALPRTETCDKCGTTFTVNGPTQCPSCEQA
jgi:hypothetical protein